MRSDLNSNLKYTPPNQEEHIEPQIKSSNRSNESIDANQILFKAHHSMSLFNSSYTNQPSSSQSSLQNSLLNSSIPLLQYYLIAYGQKKTMSDDEMDVQFKYVSRHDLDGKFIYVEPKYSSRLFDQLHALIFFFLWVYFYFIKSSCHNLTGLLPHQLISESIYNHIHPDDVNLLKKAFQEVISNTKRKIRTHQYRFKLPNNTYITIESVLYALQNPFSNQFEHIVSQNCLCSLTPNQHNSNNSSNSPSPNFIHPQYHQSNQICVNTAISNNVNTTISMPMTPSPEEIIYNNDSNSNTNSSSFANMDKYSSSSSTDYTDSKNKLNENIPMNTPSYQSQLRLTNQFINTNNNTNANNSNENQYFIQPNSLNKQHPHSHQFQQQQQQQQQQPQYAFYTTQTIQPQSSQSQTNQAYNPYHIIQLNNQTIQQQQQTIQNLQSVAQQQAQLINMTHDNHIYSEMNRSNDKGNNKGYEHNWTNL